MRRLLRSLSVVALGLVLAVGSCELPKPPIPKLDADAGGRAVVAAVAARQAVRVQPATSSRSSAARGARS